MRPIFQDPSFFVLVAFVVFLALTLKPLKKKGVALLKGYRQELEDMKAKTQEDWHNAKLSLTEAEQWQEEIFETVSEMRKIAQEEINDLRKTFQDNLRQYALALRVQKESRLKSLEADFEHQLKLEMVDLAFEDVAHRRAFQPDPRALFSGFLAAPRTPTKPAARRSSHRPMHRPTRRAP